MDNAENEDLDLGEVNEPDFSKLPGDDEDLPESKEEESAETETEEESGEATQVAKTTEKPVSLNQHLKTKRQRNEAREEADRLRKELEEARQLLAKSQPADLPPTPPTLEDCGYDTEVFRTESEKWRIEMANYQNRTAEKALQQYTQEQKRGVTNAELESKVNNALDAHYQRAEKLGIKPQKYEQMEMTVTDALGDDFAREIAVRLTNSERVMAYLGSNKQALSEIKQLVNSDPVGATLRLGEINAQFSGQTRKQSNAPAPETELRGGVTKAASSLQRQLDTAREKALRTGDDTESLRIRRKMREAGLIPA